MTFDVSQYVKQKPTIGQVTVKDGIASVPKARFDPDTGERLQDEVTEINLADEQARVDAFQQYIDNFNAFKADLKL